MYLAKPEMKRLLIMMQIGLLDCFCFQQFVYHNLFLGSMMALTPNLEFSGVHIL